MESVRVPQPELYVLSLLLTKHPEFRTEVGKEKQLRIKPFHTQSPSHRKSHVPFSQSSTSSNRQQCSLFSIPLPLSRTGLKHVRNVRVGGFPLAIPCRRNIMGVVRSAPKDLGTVRRMPCRMMPIPHHLLKITSLPCLATSQSCIGRLKKL